jgi:hypothetical protein
MVSFESVFLFLTYRKAWPFPIFKFKMVDHHNGRFVLYDAWCLTAFSSYPSLAHRLNDAYSKSCTSMFVTSLTTAVAFAASALTPLLATKSFGVFAAILVFYNYFSVIIFFPTVVMSSGCKETLICR